MKKNNNLDEMQERTLLKIEHRGFLLAFWGLVVVIYIQYAMGHNGFEYVGGETVVLLTAAAYELFACLKNGIWDRKFVPNFKTNLAISLVAGLAFGGFWFAVSYHNYHALAGSIATFVITFISMTAMVLVLLSLTSAVYKRRKQKLDLQADEEEND